MGHNGPMSDSVPSLPKRPRLRLDAGPQGPAFEAQCARDGVPPKDVLKRLIAAHLASSQSAIEPKHRPTPGTVDGKRVRRELRFTPSELRILEGAALRHGASVRDYIIAIARAHAGDAKIGRDERALLGQLNYQLLAIGRNVNQIAHRANAFDGVTQQQLSDLQAMAESLNRLSREIHAYLISGRERWRIIDD